MIAGRSREVYSMQRLIKWQTQKRSEKKKITLTEHLHTLKIIVGIATEYKTIFFNKMNMLLIARLHFSHLA